MPLARVNAFAIVAALGLASTTAAMARPASWPAFRHDQGGSGRSAAAGAIADPAVISFFGTGGALAANEARVGDLDGDGRADVAVVEAGRVALRTVTGQVAWRTAALGIDELVGAFDLDGDGRPELLAVGNGPPARMAVIDGRTGALAWMFDGVPEGAAGMRAAQVLVRDLDGDGLPEVVTSATSFDRDLRCFTFAQGFAAQPAANLLWSRTTDRYDGDTPYVAGDVDLDGRLEVVLLQRQYLTVLDGETGALELEAPDVFLGHSFGRLEIAQADEDPQPEIIALGWGASYLFAVTVFDAVDGAVTWQYQWYPTELRGMSIATNSVADLDGDGSLEITVSLFGDGADEYATVGSPSGDWDGIDEPGRWVTAVFSAADGALVDVVEDAYLHGVVRIEEGAPPTVVVQRVPQGQRTIPRFGDVAGLELFGSGLEESWSVPDAAPVPAFTPNTPARAMNVADREAAAADLDGDGVGEPLLRIDFDADGAADVLAAVDVAGGAPVWAGWTGLAGGETVRLLAAGPGISAADAGPEAVLFRSAGSVEVRGPGLGLAAAFAAGTLGAAPLVADLDADGVNEIIATTSTGAVTVLDASSAGIDGAPVAIWSAPGSPGSRLLAFDADGDGLLELPAIDAGDAVDPSLLLLDAWGEERWRHTFEGYGSPPAQLAFLARPDGGHDVALMIRDTRLPDETRERLVVLDGDSGQTAWDIARLRQSVAGPLHTADIDGDGWGDIIVVGDNRNDFYDGPTGTVLGSTVHNRVCRQSWLLDFDGDAVEEVLCSAPRATSGITLYEMLAQARSWTLPHDFNNELNGRYPGFFPFAGGMGFVKPDPQGTLVAFGPDRQVLWGPVFLRGGQISGSDPGDDIDLRYASIADIDGDGGDDVLVGTEDGWLMALDAADGSLLWSIDLHAPLGEPVVADADGDGLVEVLVAAGDGLVHVVGQAALGAPAEVRDAALDSDLSLLDPGTDVDVTERRTALGAAWDAVPGAAGYRVAIVDSGSFAVVPWLDVGSATEAVIPTAPLPLGAAFRAVVQAYGPGGSGPEAASDGVTVVDASAPEILFLAASPKTFLPPETTAVSAEARDQTWIDAWGIEILDAASSVVRATGGTGSGPVVQPEWSWDGRDGDGDLVPAGWYRVRLTVLDLAGHEAVAEIKVHVKKPGK